MGFISDKCYSKRSPVAVFSILISFFICITFTFGYEEASYSYFIGSLFILGMLLGGLNHLICITCTSDLGQQQMLRQNKKATSTVTGIIDGLGSLGTAIGQSVIGYLVQNYGWKYGYLLVISVAILMTILPLAGIFR